MKKYIQPLVALITIVCALSSCGTGSEKGAAEETMNSGQAESNLNLEDAVNPALPGFNEEASDPEAIAIADGVMEAMGGRAAWDSTRYLSWVFFGNRRLTWDKFTSDVRIDQFKDSDMKILLNVNTGKGKVYKEGQELTQPDSVAKYLERGKRIWINDSYWLVMPFKLKDTGVTLAYQGEGKAQDSTAVEVLQLTFEDVGVTPQNKYLVCVDKETSLICEWSYFPTAEDEEPRFTMPWNDYKKHGNIMLSGDRGERHLTNIMVLGDVPESTFTSFDEPNLGKKDA